MKLKKLMMSMALLLSIPLTIYTITEIEKNDPYFQSLIQGGLNDLDAQLIFAVVRAGHPGGGLAQVKKLVRAGANVDSADPNSGETVLQAAIYYGSNYGWHGPKGVMYKFIIELLLENGVDITPGAVQYANTSGNRDIINMLQGPDAA